MTLTLPDGTTLTGTDAAEVLARWCELASWATPDVLLSPRELKRNIARTVQRLDAHAADERLRRGDPLLPPVRALPWEDTDDAFLTAGAERGCWVLSPAAP